jgi:hypothetical protein
VVGILADDDDLKILGIGEAEGLKNQIPGRVNDRFGVFFVQETVKLLGVGFGFDGMEEGFPIGNHRLDYKGLTDFVA